MAGKNTKKNIMAIQLSWAIQKKIIVAIHKKKLQYKSIMATCIIT